MADGPNPLLAWVQNQVDVHYGGKWVRFTAALGMSTALKRTLMAGHASEELILRLAILRGESPTKLLRMAGKQAFADLLDQAYKERPILPSAVQTVVDVLLLHEPSNRELTEWQTSTIASAKLVQRAVQARLPTVEPAPAVQKVDAGRRAKRGIRAK